MKERVLLGMSGGVDSSVSAILLQKQGYEVIGLTMKLWQKEGDEAVGEKQDEQSIVDAQNVCKKLGIEHHVVDLQNEFKEKVVDNFICTYMCGKTPNPCIECNKFIKFGEFYNLAKKYNCKYIATGHYAKIIYSEKYNQYVLCKSNARTKDQTYFLYGINKEILPYILFPLSDFEDKDEIRNIALEAGLEVAKKKDSQEICFIQNNNYIEFLKKYASKPFYINKQINESVNSNDGNEDNETLVLKENKPGNIVLKNGEVLGTHTGLINYTIGQRKGLGISYKEPLYVVQLNTETNEVVVGTEEELYSKTLKVNELNFLLDIDLNKEIEIEAKVRYGAKPAKATLHVESVKRGKNSSDIDNREGIENIDNIDSLENKVAKVEFVEKQRAITPGQSVVFYLNDIVVGGGKII